MSLEGENVKDKIIALKDNVVKRLKTVNTKSNAIIMVAAALIVVIGAFALGERRVASQVKAQVVTSCKSGVDTIKKDMVATESWLAEEPTTVVDESARIQTKIDVWNSFCKDALPERVAEIKAMDDQVS